MRFLHTSDLLLGEEFAAIHAVADRARAARMEALRSLLALGRREKVDGIVVAGNLFADNRVGLDLVEEAGALLSKSDTPVFLLPGHRDPITPDSPYELYPDRFAGKVRILTSDDPIVLKGGVTLLPFPVRSRHASGDPTRSMPERDREPLRVGVLHTSPEGYRLAAGGLVKRELDYLFAGGALQRQTLEGVHWCGTPEPTDFGQDSGTVTLVELEAGQPARIRTAPIASLEWREEQVTVAHPDELKELSRHWSRYENRATTLLRLTLKGRLNLQGMAGVESLRHSLSARLLHLELRHQVAPSLEGLAYHHPLLNAVASSLLERASRPGSREAGLEQAEVAREALALLLDTLQSSPHSDLV